MRLDDSYAEYKFAREATGGISGWGKNSILPMPTVVLGKNENDYRFAVEYPRQEFCTIANAWQFASQSLTSAALRDNLVRIPTGSTGEEIVCLVNVRKATPIFREPVVTKFEKLVTEWKTSRSSINSGTEMFTHPAYQKIIGMGIEAVPLILKEMGINIDHWFWALKAITGKDPVPPAHRGRLKLMTKDWLSWAKKQGYQW
ncbi:MAG: hypothetical protein Q8J90_03490 [Gallionella sp.]|nr:hypothetical protein [Gallionella sp.]